MHTRGIVLEPRENVLNQMGIPYRLMEMVNDGTLFTELEKALAIYRKLEAALDAWEQANPAAAELVPWAKARKEWKEKGRPEPEWYALLWRLQNPHVIIKKKEIEQKLLKYTMIKHKQRHWDKKRAKLRAQGVKVPRRKRKS